MRNPFEFFELFLLAFGNHLFTLLAGCVVTVLIGIIEKRILKRPISLKLEVGILAAFVFFACFQAWRDEYDRASKTKQEPTVQVNVPPAQVSVNVAPPIVNIPKDGAYMAISEVAIGLSAYRIGGMWEVTSTLKNFSSNAIANQVKGLGKVEVVDTTFNQLHQPVVEEKTEDAAWQKFASQYTEEVRKQKMTSAVYGPGQTQFGTTYTGVIDSNLDADFRSTTKTIILMGKLEWTDDLGWHSTETCSWLQNYLGLLSGPGQISPNPTIIFHGCNHHNRFVKSR